MGHIITYIFSSILIQLSTLQCSHLQSKSKQITIKPIKLKTFLQIDVARSTVQDLHAAYCATALPKKGRAIPPLPDVSSWHSAELIKHKDNFTFFLGQQCS
jgi:hypothetical protein